MKNKPSWKTRLLLTIAPLFLYGIIKLYFFTCRVIVINKENEDQFLRQNRPTLFVSWHQGLLYYIYHFRHRDGIVMVSQSNDGELIARLMKLLGFMTARGSSSRGGKSAMRKMIQVINETKCGGGLVADAPRGPFGVAKMGIIKIAKETGSPLIPVMCWPKRKIMFNSWDKTILPLPFSDIVFFYGEPIFIPANTTDEQMEQIRIQLTDQLNQMHREAQAYFDKSKVSLSHKAEGNL